MSVEFDPTFCFICQDALPRGRLLVVIQGTQTVIARSDTNVCVRCGSGITDRPVANGPSGQVGLLQFEHEDYDAERLQGTIDSLATTIDNLACHACGTRIRRVPVGGGPVLSAADFAIKMLRMAPTSVRLKATCEKCSALGQCPCCAGSDQDSA